MTNRYRKKPVVIEAFQMTKERRWDNRDWPEWLNKAWNMEPGEGAVWVDADAPVREGCESSDWLVCGTLQGGHRISPRDWIIKGEKGEIYPCKPSVFAMTYEEVTDG